MFKKDAASIKPLIQKFGSRMVCPQGTKFIIKKVMCYVWANVFVETRFIANFFHNLRNFS